MKQIQLARPNIALFNAFALLTPPSQVPELHVRGETVDGGVKISVQSRGSHRVSASCLMSVQSIMRR